MKCSMSHWVFQGLMIIEMLCKLMMRPQVSWYDAKYRASSLKPALSFSVTCYSRGKNSQTHHKFIPNSYIMHCWNRAQTQACACLCRCFCLCGCSFILPIGCRWTPTKIMQTPNLLFWGKMEFKSLKSHSIAISANSSSFPSLLLTHSSGIN